MISPLEPDQQQDVGGPGLPGFRSWRAVYWFVFGWFVGVVLLLAAFTRFFS